MNNYKECVKNLGLYSKAANIFILIHKIKIKLQFFKIKKEVIELIEDIIA